MSWWIGQARWQGETGTLRLRSLRPTNTLFEAVSVVVFPISVRTAWALTMPTVLEVFLKSGPSSSVIRTTGVSSDIMYREDTPVVLMTEDEGPLFRKTSRTVGIVSVNAVLTEIGKTTTDTASNKVFVGRKDLSLNVPVSPCQRACPIHQDIAAYVDYVSQGRYLDSWLVIHETNPFPSMLGRLCNHPCETDCKRGWVQGPENAVSIKSLKRFATDYAWARRVKIDWQRAPENGRRVAIVGSGPAGMTAAQDLRLMGYQVDLYEREAKLGGLLSAS